MKSSRVVVTARGAFHAQCRVHATPRPAAAGVGVSRTHARTHGGIRDVLRISPRPSRVWDMDNGIADGFRAAAASGEIRMAGDFKCDFKCDFRKSGSDFSFLSSERSLGI
jgi:hypothetical protein